MPRPWSRSKKLRRACGGNPRGTRTRHTGRGLVPRRDAGGSKEQAHLSLGQERFSPRATHDQRTQSTYLFGAVCPERGAGAALVLSTCNGEAMQLHLDEIATKVAAGTHAVLLLDQAGWHAAKALAVPSNISLVPLPPRAPELNGQENIWQFMRQNWLSTLEDDVHRATRLGSSRSLNLKVGITWYEGSRFFCSSTRAWRDAAYLHPP